MPKYKYVKAAGFTFKDFFVDTQPKEQSFHQSDIKMH